MIVNGVLGPSLCHILEIWCLFLYSWNILVGWPHFQGSVSHHILDNAALALLTPWAAGFSGLAIDIYPQELENRNCRWYFLMATQGRVSKHRQEK